MNYEIENIQIENDLYKLQDSEAVHSTISLTYSEIVSLKNNSKLIPGQTYRIIDYNCVVASKCNLCNIKSANHPFDIIVKALAENKLDCNAKAAMHEGDTYFQYCDLDKWEIKYTVDCDENLFDWITGTQATTRGVIYYMKDEQGNEAPYDFKNILFPRYKVTAVKDPKYNSFIGKLISNTISNVITEIDSSNPYWLYTFTSSESTIDYTNPNLNKIFDATVKAPTVNATNSSIKTYDRPHYNVIHTYDDGGDYIINNEMYLPNIVMGWDDDDFSNNYFGIGCNDITLSCYCYRNVFEDNCYDIHCYGGDSYGNNFKRGCNNILSTCCIYNCDFGRNCGYIILDADIDECALGTYIRNIDVLHSSLVHVIFGTNSGNLDLRSTLGYTTIAQGLCGASTTNKLSIDIEAILDASGSGITNSNIGNTTGNTTSAHTSADFHVTCDENGSILLYWLEGGHYNVIMKSSVIADSWSNLLVGTTSDNKIALRCNLIPGTRDATHPGDYRAKFELYPDGRIHGVTRDENNNKLAEIGLGNSANNKYYDHIQNTVYMNAYSRFAPTSNAIKFALIGEGGSKYATDPKAILRFDGDDEEVTNTSSLSSAVWRCYSWMTVNGNTGNQVIIFDNPPTKISMGSDYWEYVGDGRIQVLEGVKTLSLDLFYCGTSGLYIDNCLPSSLVEIIAIGNYPQSNKIKNDILEIKATTPPTVTMKSTFTNLKMLIVPDDCSTAYKTHEYWKQFASITVEKSSIINRLLGK